MGHIRETAIPGLLIIDRPTHVDERGFFREVLRLSELEQVRGKPFHPVQWNHSHSLPRVILALHAERWNKIIYTLSGEVFTALADIRPDSPTFGKVVTFTFNDQNRHALFVPNGVANSICVIGDEPVDYLYLVDAYWDGGAQPAVAWDDPDLAINWPVKHPILSEKDTKNRRLRELFPEKFR